MPRDSEVSRVVTNNQCLSMTRAPRVAAVRPTSPVPQPSSDNTSVETRDTRQQWYDYT